MRLLFIIIATVILSIGAVNAQNDTAVDTCNYSLDIFSTKGIKELKIKTLHGKINIYNWEKESVSIESTVKILSDKIIVVEELLELIELEAIIKKQVINVSANLNKDFSSTIPYEITHNVFVPNNIALNITNSHGTVVIPEITTGTNLKLSYCDLRANNIVTDNTGSRNYITLAYCKAELNAIGNATIKSNSSDINIAESNTVILKSEYSKILFNQNKRIEGSTNIDKLSIINTDSIYLKGENSQVIINNYNLDAKLELNNGSLEITNSASTINSLLISNNNTITSIQLNKNASYILNGEIKDGIISHPHMSDINLIKETNQTSFSGVIGENKAATAKVIVFNKNQNITFK